MSSRIALIAGGVAALLIAVIVALYFILGGEDEAENAVTTSQQSAPAPAEQVEQAVEQVLPTFDIVRVERDGMAVIAGRATPGAEITLKRNGTAIATVDADARGEWVIVLDEPLAPGDIELTLSAVNPDGSTVDGVQSVSVSVPAQAGGQTLVVLAEPGKASRVLQGPGVPSDSGSLILESVDYDEKGNVIVAGRTDPGSTVRVYLNGGPIGDATADQKGQWELRLSVSNRVHTRCGSISWTQMVPLSPAWKSRSNAVSRKSCGSRSLRDGLSFSQATICGTLRGSSIVPAIVTRSSIRRIRTRFAIQT